MRCRFCGSTSLHSADEQKGFSTGKAVAGTIVFGPVGAVAGLSGKKIHGLRCSACGQFMESAMDLMTEKSVNDAIYSAKSGSLSSMYSYYKKQYPNIETVSVPDEKAGSEFLTDRTNAARSSVLYKNEEDNVTEKRIERYGLWQPDCPAFCRSIIIKNNGTEDLISLDLINQSKKTIRSLYIQTTAFDDTGDILTTSRCVYQGVSVGAGQQFPINNSFGLGTDLTYRVELFFEKAAFEDGEVWRAGEREEAIKLPETVKIDSETFPRYKYLLKEYKNRKSSENQNLFKPICLPETNEAYWICTCGMPVKKGEKCPRCQCDYDFLQKIFSQEYLQQKQREEVFERAAKRTKEVQKARAAVIEKQLSLKYDEAVRLKKEDNEESLNKAAETFAEIRQYKDADSLEKACYDRLKMLEEENKRKKKEEEKQAVIRRQQEEAAAKKRKRRWIAIIIFAAACIAAFLVITKVIIPENIYRSALAHKDSGDYITAYEEFDSLKGYKDSEILKSSVEADYRISVIGNSKEGDTVVLGGYEQDNDSTNGKEPIEWIILETRGERVLLVSKYVLDCKQYNSDLENVTWETSSVREWLNSTFINEAFTTEERGTIALTNVSAEDNLRYSTNAGNDTQDRLFLLSIDEAEQYFYSVDERRCEPTAYINANRSHEVSYFKWWLRSPGQSNKRAANVEIDGHTSKVGNQINFKEVGIRPALWVDVSGRKTDGAVSETSEKDYPSDTKELVIDNLTGTDDPALFDPVGVWVDDEELTVLILEEDGTGTAVFYTGWQNAGEMKRTLREKENLTYNIKDNVLECTFPDSDTWNYLLFDMMIEDGEEILDCSGYFHRLDDETAQVYKNSDFENVDLTGGTSGESASEEDKTKAAYEKCINVIKSNSEHVDNELFAGNMYLIIPAQSENAYETYIGVRDNTEGISVLFSAPNFDGKWCVDFNGQKAVYTIHSPFSIESNDCIVECSGEIDLSTYDQNASYIPDKVVVEGYPQYEEEPYRSMFNDYPAMHITPAITCLEWWLEFENIGVSLEELGISFDSKSYYDEADTSQKSENNSTSNKKSSGSSNSGSRKGSSRTCPNCNGTGSVKTYYGESALEAYLAGQDDYTIIECPMCHGTGKVTD